MPIEEVSSPVHVMEVFEDGRLTVNVDHRDFTLVKEHVAYTTIVTLLLASAGSLRPIRLHYDTADSTIKQVQYFFI